MSKRYFHDTIDRLIAARERHVRRYVNGALLNLDDDALMAIGRTREEIRREGVMPYYL